MPAKFVVHAPVSSAIRRGIRGGSGGQPDQRDHHRASHGDGRAVVLAMVDQLPRDRSPNLIDVSRDMLTISTDERFEFAQGCLLDGIEADRRGP